MISIGKVAVTLTVMPSSAEASLKALGDTIKKALAKGGAEVKSVSEKPVAFGLKALEILLILPDATGGTDKIENELLSVEGVESVQIEDTTLI